MLAGSAPVAAITPSVTEYKAGVTPGFSTASQPDGIAAGADGNLWFIEENNPGRAVRITPAGAVTEFGSGIVPNTTPGEIAPGPDGNLWFVQETDPGRIGRITTAGAVQEFTGGVTPNFTANSFPDGITGGPDGNVWFTESANPGRVARITPAGVVTEFEGGVTPNFTANSSPGPITAGPDGNLWFLEDPSGTGRIARITPAGVVTEFTSGLTPNAFLATITGGPDGNVWFTADADPGRIGRITPAGVITEFRGGVTPGFSANSIPEGIATGPDGNLWFTERSDPGRVARITPAGVVTEFAAGTTPGFTPNGTPNKVTAGPDGNLWFTSELGRVSRFNIVPPLALTGGVSGLTTTSATIAGTANGRDLLTTVRFDFGRPGRATTATPAQSVGSGLADTPASANLTGLAPGTTYQYRTLATNPTDTTVGAFRTFTTFALASISRLGVVPKILRAAGRGGSIRQGSVARKRKPPIGARVSYRDSQPATTTFTALRRVRGVKRGKKCVKPPKGKSKRKRCTRWVRVGSFKHVDRAGRNSFRFTGRIRGRKLKPGRYRLQAVPRFAGSNGKAVKTSFRVVR
jgi:streptogramin lyase